MKTITKLKIRPYYFLDSMDLSRVGTEVSYFLDGKPALARFLDVISSNEAARFMLMNLP